ncbi:MAG: hypothetical protein ABIF18_00230 [archaeon]
MKGDIIFGLLILVIISAEIISAGGVGISPVYYKEFFEPGLEKNFTFNAFNTKADEGVNIYVKGDLADYVTLSNVYFLGNGEFTVSLKLPEKIDTPGTHKIIIGAIEAKSETEEGVIGGIAAIQGRIDILVPYPGKYSESTFTISDINEGEEATYEIETENLGSQDLEVKTTIEIYKDNMSENVLTKRLKEKIIRPKEISNIIETIDTRNLPPGEYQALATIDWGKIDKVNQTFRIGEFLVEVIDYDYQFEENKINEFNIKIQNKWNMKIDQVFATLSITDEGRLLRSFKTVSVDTSPWEVKNLTSYFDTTGLEIKRYTANIILNYGEEVSSKLIAIYIKESPKNKYTKYIIIAVIVALIIIATFIYLILRIRKLSKNAKKK